LGGGARAHSVTVTLDDLAREAGVSRTTASLVLRRAGRVSAVTRERVLGCADRLGYVYNRHAARLRTRRSGTIGLLVTDVANPFVGELVKGVNRVLAEQDQVVFLGHTGENPLEQERLLRRLREQAVDGIIVMPARGTGPDLAARLDAMELPSVFLVRRLGSGQEHVVAADDRSAARIATAHLIGLGHERIAYVGGLADSLTAQDRHKGYREALAEARLGYRRIVASTNDRRAGFEAASAILDEVPAPTAAVCYSDVVAFGLMLGLFDRGLRPGPDFAVVGTDDVAEAALWRPALTTVAVRPEALGEAAARRLLERLAGAPVAAGRSLLEPRLVVRDSSGPSLYRSGERMPAREAGSKDRSVEEQ
jgi:LacI family transcriptional regulator